MSHVKKDCSLEIFPLNWEHHKQKIYPWVDPENVGRFTHRFYDTTVTIEVLGKLQRWAYKPVTCVGESF